MQTIIVHAHISTACLPHICKYMYIHIQVSETEERKNAQAETARRRADKALSDMRNYYNDITLNNLAMIGTLKEELKAKDEKLERSEQLLGSVQAENK